MRAVEGFDPAQEPILDLRQAGGSNNLSRALIGATRPIHVPAHGW